MPRTRSLFNYNDSGAYYNHNHKAPYHDNYNHNDDQRVDLGKTTTIAVPWQVVAGVLSIIVILRQEEEEDNHHHSSATHHNLEQARRQLHKLQRLPRPTTPQQEPQLSTAVP